MIFVSILLVIYKLWNIKHTQKKNVARIVWLMILCELMQTLLS